MSFFNAITAHSVANMPQGLLAWARGQGPASWHEIARYCDFGDVRSGIDPLLAAYWITRQESCDRATALLFLARALEAGFIDQPPAHHDLRACLAFSLWLHLRLDDGAYQTADLALTASEAALVRCQLGPHSRLALPKAVRAVAATSQGFPVLAGLKAMSSPLTSPLSTLRGRIQVA
jgi:hypothetical protein